MSQLLNALKTLDRNSEADVPAVQPYPAPLPEIPPETSAPPDSSSNVELPDEPDIVWPPDEPAAAVQEVVEQSSAVGVELTTHDADDARPP